MTELITPPGAPVAAGPYSPGLLTGDWIFLSGQGGFDPETGELVSDNIADQTAQVFRNIEVEFGGLSTPLVADACVRVGVPLRVAPPGIGAVIPGQRIAGRALPARHYGSVDVFLEAFSGAAHGDVLVVDNSGREDEACLGDLIVLEAQAAGVGGVAVWGLHRDTAELTQIALPVFSYGRCPAGPVRLDEQEPSALASARFGACLVTRDDIVFGDDDGVVFVAASRAGEVLAAARQIGDVEQDQARKIQAGQTLRQQTAFSEYLARRAAEPSYTFRRHLRRIGGAIEE